MQYDKTNAKEYIKTAIMVVIFLSLVILLSMGFSFANTYTEQIISDNNNIAELLSGNVSNFIDGAYNLSEELATNPSIYCDLGCVFYCKTDNKTD